MRTSLLLLFSLLSFSSLAKEWKSLSAYQKETNQKILSPSDWLKQDRKYNTLIWKRANQYNLENNKPLEYVTINQRRDFYWWVNDELQNKGHEIVWPKMAYFITRKLALTQVFIYSVFIRKEVKEYSKTGSEIVFNNAFPILSNVFFSETILKGKAALEWDKVILEEEQYNWIEKLYSEMDSRSLKTIERMAKGKGFYSLMVPKVVRFKGEISNPKERYDYALNTLRDFCIERYK